MRKYRWIAGLFLWICLLMPTPVWAQGEKSVVDQADLLSAEEEQLLSQKTEELSETWKQDFVVVTTSDAEGKTSEEYADDYYDNNGYQENGVLYLIDMDNRSVWISTSGAMIRFLTDQRIERVIDEGYEQLKSGEYADCFMKMLGQTEIFMGQGIPDNQYNYDTETGEISRYRTVTAMELVIAVIAAVAAGVIFVVLITTSYKMKHGRYSYPFHEKGRMDLTQKEDRFINEVVTRRKIQQNNSSGGGKSGGGGSSIHTSGGGHSHGGGGRSF